MRVSLEVLDVVICEESTWNKMIFRFNMSLSRLSNIHIREKDNLFTLLPESNLFVDPPIGDPFPPHGVMCNHCFSFSLPLAAARPGFIQL
ncbi:hypothetical protein BC830DRAFT_1112090 [Chytriomyces sp. MP71]|nr:hypothetical protein BC830DRAFT_1112090 [Chytriomyces sp. MP71]